MGRVKSAGTFSVNISRDVKTQLVSDISTSQKEMPKFANQAAWPKLFTRPFTQFISLAFRASPIFGKEADDRRAGLRPKRNAGHPFVAARSTDENKYRTENLQNSQLPRFLLYIILLQRAKQMNKYFISLSLSAI